VLDARLVSDMQALAITVVSDLACGLAMFTPIFLPKYRGKELEAFH
jgi:hypothetical protein